MLTTTEVALVDGTPLNTLAYNIETLTGREGIPPRRGENSKIAYRNGAAWRRKRYDQKTETWAMWVRGADEDGNIPAHGQRAEFNSNLQMLKELFGKIYEPLNLERRILMPSGLLVLTAQAECVSTLDPSMLVRATAAKFSADLEFADPFWYGVETTVPLVAGANVFTHPGTALADHMEITFTGPATNPSLSNDDLGILLQYTGEINTGHSVTFDTSIFTALHSTNGNVIGAVTHTGSVPWMELKPGAQTLTLSGGPGVTASVVFKPPYL